MQLPPGEGVGRQVRREERLTDGNRTNKETRVASVQLISLPLVKSERRAVRDDHVGEEGQASHLQAAPLPAPAPGRRRCHGDCPQPSSSGKEGQAGPGKASPKIQNCAFTFIHPQINTHVAVLFVSLDMQQTYQQILMRICKVTEFKYINEYYGVIFFSTSLSAS